MPTPEITFSPDEEWNDERESIVLMAQVDGRPVTCIIPFEFLTAPHVKVPDGDHAIRLFAEKRHDIEQTLLSKIEKGDYTSPGEIILKTIVEKA